MTRNTLIALAVVLGAALLWLVGVRGASEDRKLPGPAQDSSPAKPASEVTRPAQGAGEHEAATHARAPSAEPGAQQDQPEAEADDMPTDPPNVSRVPVPERTGPVDELKEQFRTEPRASNAGRIEKHIEAVFRADDMPPELLKSVLCRRSVCRIETRWTAERAENYMAAMMRLVTDASGAKPSEMFDPEIAISPEGEMDDNGVLAVDLYVRLRDPSAVD